MKLSYYRKYRVRNHYKLPFPEMVWTYDEAIMTISPEHAQHLEKMKYVTVVEIKDDE